MAADDGLSERERTVFSWAVDHFAEQVNFGVPLVVGGDPEVLAGAGELPDLAPGSWTLERLSGGVAMAVTAPTAEADGPWLTVTRTSDGPLERAVLAPTTWTDAGAGEQVGELTSTSGRLVFGDPDTVARWGPAVGPGTDQDIESKTGWDDPAPGHYVGLVVVVRLSPGARCPIELVTTPGGDFHALGIKFPTPGWVGINARPIV